MNTSLEVEYWVVDGDGDLVSSDPLLDVADWIVPEFVEPVIEIKTSPCSSMAELRAEFLDRIETVVDAARDRGRRLVPLATPLSAPPAEIPYREKESTDLQRRIVGPTFDDARVCVGTHVHFERQNPADQLNALTAIDPAFALVNSSSYYRGERLIECARPYLYRRSCYERCPRQGQLWPYVDSVDEWERKLDDAYESFKSRALRRGVAAAEFEAAFDPYDAVWTPVRLRTAVPTVEWRSPDATLPSEILRLTDAVRAFVVDADQRGTTVVASDGTDDRQTNGRQLPAFETVESITDAAIRDGLSNARVRTYLRSLGFDPSAFEPLANQHTDARLTTRRAKRLRLDAARQLEADLTRARHRVPARSDD
ncbi:glutamate-cysteine ligase family protein [Halovivax gelatinilyticus]|uniref:glutamate-cysteine ligase family protein n=1 Tax=Halovivax gelatinilyticus TaxID=2961597 RepID=UPI0020CA434A|nr:glutamate-cysteine ligase family protein [Halovivax gelatinilyticus]